MCRIHQKGAFGDRKDDFLSLRGGGNGILIKYVAFVTAGTALGSQPARRRGLADPCPGYINKEKRSPTMYWFNPKIRKYEDVPAPLNDPQAIEMLSGHPNSDEFIEEYRRWRETAGIAAALIYTGETFQMETWGGQPPR